MKEFILIFRMDILSKEARPSKKQMKIYMEEWKEWLNEIAGKKQLLPGGNHLKNTGRLLKPKGIIIDNPYASKNESIAGYILVTAKNINDAMKIAKKCPILAGKGTSVEIRQIDK